MSSKNSIAGVRQRRAGEQAPITGRNTQRQQFSPQQQQQFVQQQQFATQQQQQFVQQQQPQFVQQQQPQFVQQQQQQFAQQQQPQFAAQKGQQKNQVPVLQRQTNKPSVGNLVSNVPQSGPEQIGNGPGKLSVSDAFALVTLRLGRLETFMNKYYLDTINEENDDIKMDNSVVKSIINRLEKLEQNNENNLIQKVDELQTIHENTDESRYKTNNELINNEINILKNEISYLKDTLTKLQTFAMDTNTRLVQTILTSEKDNSDNNSFFLSNLKETSNFPICYSLDEPNTSFLDAASYVLEYIEENEEKNKEENNKENEEINKEENNEEIDE
jgi:hypothetical protein